MDEAAAVRLSEVVAACRMALPAKMTEEIPAVGDVPSMLFVL
jgi:hypothetical protein